MGKGGGGGLDEGAGEKHPPLISYKYAKRKKWDKLVKAGRLENVKPVQEMRG